MHYPTVSWAGIQGAGNEVNALSLANVRSFIATQAPMVHEGEDGRFHLDPKAETLDPDTMAVIASATARANLFRVSAGGIQGAGDDGIYKQVREALKGIDKVEELAKKFETVVKGCLIHKVHWSGLTLSLTRDAGSALVDIMKADAAPVVTLLLPFSVKLAAILTVLSVSSHVLAKFVEKENGEKGVLVELLLWLVPAVSANEIG